MGIVDYAVLGCAGVVAAVGVGAAVWVEFEDTDPESRVVWTVFGVACLIVCGRIWGWW